MPPFSSFLWPPPFLAQPLKSPTSKDRAMGLVVFLRLDGTGTGALQLSVRGSTTDPTEKSETTYE